MAAATNPVASPAAPGAAATSAAAKKDRRVWFRRKQKQAPSRLLASLTKADDTERFIPVPRAEILKRLTADQLWPPGVAPVARRMFRYLASWRHVGYNELLDRLDQSYDLFAPDSDIQIDQVRSQEEVDQAKADFLKKMRHLLVHANFEEIPRATLDMILTGDSEYGLDLTVDFDDFEDIMIFWRGTGEQTRRVRETWRPWRHREVTYPVYKRLFLLLKMKPQEQRIREMMRDEKLSYKAAKRRLASRRRMLPKNADDNSIYLKIFKDIPLADLEMMFPNTKVRIRGLDKLKLAMTAGGSVGGVLAGPVLKLTAAATAMAALSPAALGMVALGLAGVGARQIGNVISQRRHYLAVLAQNLYFHTLADNRAAITLLASRAEEEDVKEDMLLYSVLVKETVHRSDMPRVAEAVTKHLQAVYGVRVGFDAEESLGRLIKDGIVTEERDGRLLTLPPWAALEHLDKMWDGYLDPEGMDRQLIDELD